MKDHVIRGTELMLAACQMERVARAVGHRVGMLDAAEFYGQASDELSVYLASAGLSAEVAESRQLCLKRRTALLELAWAPSGTPQPGGQEGD